MAKCVIEISLREAAVLRDYAVWLAQHTGKPASVRDALGVLLVTAKLQMAENVRYTQGKLF